MSYTIENANETMNQMGGCNRLKAMVGANSFVYSSDDHFISFKFKMCQKMNYIKITLNDLDTYDLEFGKIWGTSYKVVKEFDDVYCDQLKSIFESETGLYLSL